MFVNMNKRGLSQQDDKDIYTYATTLTCVHQDMNVKQIELLKKRNGGRRKRGNRDTMTMTMTMTNILLYINAYSDSVKYSL